MPTDAVMSLGELLLRLVKLFGSRALPYRDLFSHGLASPIVLLIVLKTFIEDNRRWRYAIRGEKHAVLAAVEDNSLSHGMSGVNCYHHSGILTEA